MFRDFVKAIQKNLQQMSKDSSRLFTVNVDTEELYNLYLDSFPAGTNEIYRERREYDCSCCRHFIRDVGNVVSIKNGELHTISWSRVNCVHNGLYEYFLKYVLHKKEDRDDSIYKVTGGISHDIIERFYTEELAYEKMAEFPLCS